MHGDSYFHFDSWCRCHRFGGRSRTVNFDTLTSRLKRASKSNFGSRYVIDTRHVHIKHLRSFSFHGWPRLPGSSSLARVINSRSIVKIQSSGLLRECVAPERDKASVDDDGLSTIRFAGEVVWEETTASTDGAERATESTFSSELLEEGSFTEEEQKFPADSQLDPTIIVFDIETTGFLKAGSKIVELACRDLAGGDRSTLETLVNPYQPCHYQPQLFTRSPLKW